MGPATLRRLKANAPPTAREMSAMRKVCDAAAAKRIRVSPAAEPQNAQQAVNDWTLNLARTYNGGALSSGAPAALIYNTYQCYLISTPKTLLADILVAEKEGFTLGAKLVRGAYLASEERKLIHATKQETDDAYNRLTKALLDGRFEGPLALNALEEQSSRDGEQTMKRVDVLLATHNADTVDTALQLRAARVAHAIGNGQTISSSPLGDLSFAQLQGMADEVSCALLAAQRSNSSAPTSPSPFPFSTQETFCNGPVPHVYKYCNWGTLSECLAYLTRRAAENRDAAGRTRNTALAMRGEIVRRL